MKITIKKEDHLGNGIGFLDGKITFVPKCITGDEVEIKLIKETKNYNKAKLIKIINPSEKRIDAFCRFYDKCGGCHLQNFTYDDSLKFKEDKVKNILSKVNNKLSFEIIKNDYDKNYRNKIELKIINQKIGYFEKETNNLVEINKCMIAKNAINNFLDKIDSFNIKNGDITLRCNYNDELLIIINSQDKISLDKDIFIKHKVVGVIYNNKTIYGENHFIDIIDNLFFDISYNSFFQINSFINEKLFAIIKKHVSKDNVLDLYSGVGTLSICASKIAKKVYAIENNQNATLSAIKNAKINKCHNINFILGNAEDKIKYIKDKIDTIIIDPPRSGLDNKIIDKIIKINPSNIIFISCEVQKMSENLKLFLNNYKINKCYILDMFSYTYHVECVVLLSKVQN